MEPTEPIAKPDVDMANGSNGGAKSRTKKQAKEKRDATATAGPDTDDLANRLGSLAVGNEKSSADYLVRCWLVAEHQEHRRKAEWSRTIGEAAIGKEPKTDEEWHAVLLKLYGEEQLEHLCSDPRALEIGIAGCLPESRSRPRWCRIFDWLQRSEAGFLQYAPMMQWTEVTLDTSLHHRSLENSVALGVGLEYAAMIAKNSRDKRSNYSVYCARISDASAHYANNVMQDSLKEAIEKEGFAKVKRERLAEGVCAYERSSLSFAECPDSGFVSGHHVVLCWPNINTGRGFYDRFGIYKMPECFSGQGNDPSTGNLKQLGYVFDAPNDSVRELCLVFPYLLFVTTTAQFDLINFVRHAVGFGPVRERLRAEKLKHVGPRRDADVIVIMDMEKNAIVRVVPVTEGKVSHLSTYPRFTCPLDAYVPQSKWRIIWNVLNAAKPDEHGLTWFEPFFITAEEAALPEGPPGSTRGLFWRRPEEELEECERGIAMPFSSKCIEESKAIHAYNGGHVVHISENNTSTFVARNGDLYPRNNLYHGRDIKTLDSVIYGGLIVTLTPTGDIQVASVRVVSSEIKPALVFAEADLEKALDRKLPKGVTRVASSYTVDMGPYKAIWNDASYRFVIQLSNGTLVAMWPRTLQEIRDYLEAKARIEARDIRRRAAQIISEKQLQEAHAMGVEPIGAAMARLGSNEKHQPQPGNPAEAAKV